MQLVGIADRFMNVIFTTPEQIEKQLSAQITIDDLAPEAIKSLLEFSDDLTDDQMIDIKDFLERIGGSENARRAIKLLSEIALPSASVVVFAKLSADFSLALTTGHT